MKPDANAHARTYHCMHATTCGPLRRRLVLLPVRAGKVCRGGGGAAGQATPIEQALHTPNGLRPKHRPGTNAKAAQALPAGLYCLPAFSTLLVASSSPDTWQLVHILQPPAPPCNFHPPWHAQHRPWPCPGCAWRTRPPGRACCRLLPPSLQSPPPRVATMWSWWPSTAGPAP